MTARFSLNHIQINAVKNNTGPSTKPINAPSILFSPDDDLLCVLKFPLLLINS